MLDTQVAETHGSNVTQKDPLCTFMKNSNVCGPGTTRTAITTESGPVAKQLLPPVVGTNKRYRGHCTCSQYVYLPSARPMQRTMQQLKLMIGATREDHTNPRESVPALS